MTRPAVLIFHRPASFDEPPLVRFLAEVRAELARRQAALLERAGAAPPTFVDEWYEDLAFGEVIRRLAPARGGVIVLGSGAVVRLNLADARRLVAVASSGRAEALTNNRYSSDIVALGRASVLKKAPALPTDNALPRWLEELAGIRVDELAGRDRLALDLDTPLDVCLAALAPGAPAWLRRAVDDAGLAVPRLDDLRGVGRDPLRELAGIRVDELAGRDPRRSTSAWPRSLRERRRGCAAQWTTPVWRCHGWTTCAAWGATRSGSCSSLAAAGRARWPGWSATCAAGCVSWPRSAACAPRVRWRSPAKRARRVGTRTRC